MSIANPFHPILSFPYNWEKKYSYVEFQNEFGFPYTGDGWYNTDTDSILVFNTNGNSVDINEKNLWAAVFNFPDGKKTCEDIINRIRSYPTRVSSSSS